MSNFRGRRKAGLSVSIFLLGIVLLSFALVFFLSPKEFEILERFSVLIGIAASVITIIVAILLYDTLGIDDSILSKNLEAVEQLVHVLRKTRIELRAGKFISFLNLHRPWEKGELEATMESLQKGSTQWPIVFEMKNSGSGLQALMHLYRGLYLPRQIKEKLAFIDIGGTYGPAESKEVVEVTISNHPVTKGDFGYPMGPRFRQYVNCEEYINFWREVQESIKKWLQENSGRSLDFDIEDRTPKPMHSYIWGDKDGI